VRVVIADDSALLREGLTRLLVESGVEVVATVGDAVALIAAVEEHRPDVAIVDIRMPPTYTHEGAEAAVELRERGHRLGVLLLSQAVETHFAAQLLERHSESFGYLLKDRVIDVATLMSALQTIQGGGTVLDPEIVQHLMARDAAADPLSALTERERDVLALMAEGRSNSAIADRLTVSLKTVESHIANIFSKLGLHGAQDDHRRVLAVLAALGGGAEGVGSPTA
jgi:DNA-binding NarL/FixJ family response regulator